MVTTAAPDEPGLAGITMLVTDTSSATGVRFLPSFIDSLLPVILLSFLTVLHSRLPHLLPSYLFTFFSLSLSHPLLPISFLSQTFLFLFDFGGEYFSLGLAMCAHNYST